MATITNRNEKKKVRFQKAVNTYNEWRVRRQTAVQLKKLNNRQLQDIGISRYEINTIADNLSKRV